MNREAAIFLSVILWVTPGSLSVSQASCSLPWRSVCVSFSLSLTPYLSLFQFWNEGAGAELSSSRLWATTNAHTHTHKHLYTYIHTCTCSGLELQRQLQMHFAKYFGRKTFGTYTQRIYTYKYTYTRSGNPRWHGVCGTFGNPCPYKAQFACHAQHSEKALSIHTQTRTYTT